MSYHLAILKRPYLEAILAGRKRIESRFTRTRRGAFGEVEAGDTLFLKESSGPVRATASVCGVKRFANLTAQKMGQLEAEYNHLVCGDDKYWRGKGDCRYGVLIWLEDVHLIEPVRIAKKDWRAWVVLTEAEDFGLLKKRG